GKDAFKLPPAPELFPALVRQSSLTRHHPESPRSSSRQAGRASGREGPAPLWLGVSPERCEQSNSWITLPFSPGGVTGIKHDLLAHARQRRSRSLTAAPLPPCGIGSGIRDGAT